MTPKVHRAIFAAIVPALRAAHVQSVPVYPNPKSLLKSKKVLVVEATNWNGNSHKTREGERARRAQQDLEPFQPRYFLRTHLRTS